MLYLHTTKNKIIKIKPFYDLIISKKVYKVNKQSDIYI